MKEAEKTIHGYFLADAARLAQLSIEMVDYLCRTEVLVPSARGGRGRGKRRVYSFGDVVVLRALAKLLKRGISVKALRSSLRLLKQHHADITPSSVPADMLLTDGEKIYFRSKKQALQDLVSGQFSFAFVLELDALRQEVQDRAIKTVKRAASGT